VDRVSICEESIDGIEITAIPHGVHELGQRTCVVCHDQVLSVSVRGLPSSCEDG